MNFIHNLRKGFARPFTMPIWKIIIVYVVWVICITFYVLSMFKTIPYLIIALITQIVALTLPYFFDTGNWKNTDKGKAFINKYGE